MVDNMHRCSSLDSFLEQEGTLNEFQAKAIKEVIAWQLADAMEAHVLIDPPDGSCYGFPKAFSGDIETLDLNEWLLSNGYPQKVIDLFGGKVPCRIIHPVETDD